MPSSNPPEVLADRQEGWGTFGHIKGFDGYRDTGVWPEEVTHLENFETEQPETSDDRDSGWFRNGELIATA